MKFVGALPAVLIAGLLASASNPRDRLPAEFRPHSQEQGGAAPAATTLSVDVKVVTLPVTVRDKHNQIVTGLTKADFSLTDNTHPQTIKYFSLDKNLPLTLGLLVDSSMSQRSVLEQEKTATKTFLQHMLTVEKDKAFVLHFDSEVELLQDLTPSREKLEAAVDLIQSSPTRRQDDTDGSSAGRMPGGTQLYDAVFLASEELMRKQQGRKALILLTDGVDRGSKESLNSAIEAAQRGDTVVYAIYFKGERGGGGGFAREAPDGTDRQGGGYPGGYPGGGYPRGGYPGGGYPGGGYPGGRRGGGQAPPSERRVDGKEVLRKIAGETGGRMFEASKKETIDQIYASIEEELRSQYMLGYTPEKTDPGPGYHKLLLSVSRQDVTVQTRAGYYAER